MKAHLLYADRDLNLAEAYPDYMADLQQDVELATVLDVMAHDDEFIRDICQRVLLLSLSEPHEIVYRQQILADCLQHPELVRELYAIAVEACDSKRRAQVFWFRDSPEMLVHKSLRVLTLLVESMKRLRQAADDHSREFQAPGFTTLFETLERELDDDYLALVDEQLQRLEFKDGILISARLGRGNRSAGFVLRKSPLLSFFQRLTRSGHADYSFVVPDRDESGMQTLGELRSRGLRLVARSLAQSTDHVYSFFTMLRRELAFYVGCLNLQEQLASREQSIAFPETSNIKTLALRASGLYDVALVFHSSERVVGNELEADGANLIIVTGANQGGKSTFVRSLGLAQLMAQAGMFVGAESLSLSVTSGVFTHFKREEDETMTSGKLDEELVRMSRLADAIQPGALLLCNESFSSTNEREGSEIGRQVTQAMVESGVRVVYVTHMFDLANGFRAEERDSAVFLRAERNQDGSRTFRVVPGDPLPTSYGEDSYRRIFGSEPVTAS